MSYEAAMEVNINITRDDEMLHPPFLRIADAVAIDYREHYDCDVDTWNMICYSFDIDCIHCDNHIRLCKTLCYGTRNGIERQ